MLSLSFIFIRFNSIRLFIMKTSIPPVKGTRDFYPPEMALRTWLYQVIRRVSESYGYQEYEGPFLESIELYAAKSGDELVKEQSFVFPDRGGNLITLRPELTPTLVRMVAQRQNQLAFPIRWWSFGPFWRYERPQKGRTREFFQWNIDLIGSGSASADAELIAIIATFFRQVGLAPQDALIFVNNRPLMEAEIRDLGIPPDSLKDIFRLIDRKDKMRLPEWERYAEETGLNPQQTAGLKAILENGELWQKSEDLQQLFPALEALGVSEYVRFAPEHHPRPGLLHRHRLRSPGDRRRLAPFDPGRRALRQPDLRRGRPAPPGHRLRDGRRGDLPAPAGARPGPPGPGPLAGAHPGGGLRPGAPGVFPALAAELRREGINTVCYGEPDKLARQFRYADRIGARFVAILGPDELERGS
jgi:histidyl-tRNA synthetase